MLLSTRNTPRWIIFLIDLFVCTTGFVIAYLLRFEFHPPQLEIDLALKFFSIFIGIRALAFLIGKTYAGIIRFTSTQDAMRIFLVLISTSIVFALLNQIRNHWFDHRYFLPNSIIIIEFLITMSMMIMSRIAVKLLYLELKTPSRAKRRVVIYGAGEAGVITKRTLERDRRAAVQVIAFIDDDEHKSGKKIEGTTIYHASKAGEIFSSGKADELVLAIEVIDRRKKNAMINLALRHNVQVRNIPPVSQWLEGQLNASQIRNVRIEDLLGREPIRLDSSAVHQQVKGKTVIVTGAAGSIGSELVRQLLAYEPSKLVLCDQAETPLFELENSLKDSGQPVQHCEMVMGDVRQHDRMKRMMEYFRPQVVYHAAAYKHVPLMEQNPSEAVLANVLGTKNLVDLSDEYGVETFVLVSTDKAVNPTSVMGATKRVAEMYTQSKNTVSSTHYITTRFGNVLGSNGSVIPIFRKQIEAGGPVTVTHRDVTRFFMTIPEAASLVLEAGAMGKGGEIFAFDMGETIRISDLAENMIRLSGFEPHSEIQIKYTGLRPGEKLYEEVLEESESTVKTHHPKILQMKVSPRNYEELDLEVNALISLFDKQDNADIVRKLKRIVPQYKSKNSVFEQLDTNFDKNP
ncbi:MAG: polysaccharide biosynthesis protein [Flavobacteriales bacterium]|nr:polysaccharide biosynthesis protein [Flavobacteriales bacterium]